MQKRQLGRSGIHIAPLVFGGNVFGWTADEPTSFALLDRFVEQGFNAIDTADVYSGWVPGNAGGESETVIGNWLARRGGRGDVVLISKVGMWQQRPGLSAANIEAALEDSLRRLRTDYLDVYFAHLDDEAAPLEETLRAFERLLGSGKVRAIGASNHTPARVKAALAVSADKGLPRYEVLQPMYNLYDRTSYEGALRDVAMAEQLGVITYSSLASGFLTGKYRSKNDLGKSVRGGGVEKYLDARGLRILDALDAVAKAQDAQPAEVALAWLVTREGVTAPIASATSVEHVDSLIRATQLTLTAADIALLDDASALA